MKVLIVSTNCLLSDEILEKMRKQIIDQINSDGILALDGRYNYELVELDALKCEGELISYADKS